MTIRPITPADSYNELTSLLHRAYEPLAVAGMHFVASHQSAETTKRRCESGKCFVAELEGQLVGTITLYSAEPESGCLYYRQPGSFHFGQFAVDPVQQGKGIGKQLLDRVEQEARNQGVRNLALDTSERAEGLIRLYSDLGFREVERVDWGEMVNYTSVILSKSL